MQSVHNTQPTGPSVRRQHARPGGSAIEKYFAEHLLWDGNQAAEDVAREFGLVARRAILVTVPEHLGGGWLVLIQGPSNGANGFIARIDRQGWIFRVAMNPDGTVPTSDTPIVDVLEQVLEPPTAQLPAEIDEDDFDDDFDDF